MSTAQLGTMRPTTLASCSGAAAAFKSPPVSRYQPLVLVAVAVCGGIVADRLAWRWTASSFELWWLVAAVAWAAWLLLWRTDRLVAATVALVVTLVAIGGAWHHARWHLFGDDELGRIASEESQPFCMEVVTTTPPQVLPQPPPDPLRTIPATAESRFVAEVVSMRDGFAWKSASGQARIWCNGSLNEIQLGDRLRLFGQLVAPMPPANPGEFDFAAHARADRQLSVVSVEFPECIRLVETASSRSLSHWLNEARQSGNRLLHRYLSSASTALASALLLGQRGQIDRDTNDAFLETGTIHILSISGLHVAILAWILFKAFRTGWMSRRAALLAVAIITGGYMLLTGAEPPVVRATLLVWIFCGSLWMGKSGIALNSLAFAALVVLALNPADLFRTGVQLSFLSVAVLMWVVPKVLPPRSVDPLDRLIAATRPKPQRMATKLGRNLGWAFAVGAILWLLIAPITMSRFNLLSPAGLVLNVVLAPIVTFVMASGFGILAFGWLLPPLGAACGWLCDLNLHWLDSIVKSAATWPGSYFSTPGPSEGWLITLYLAAAAALILPRAVPPLRWRVAMTCGWCGLASFASLPTPNAAGELRCTFVSVGHGCAIVLELPDGKALLYDAGRLGSPAAAERSLSGYLWSRHISHLDAVVVSHADADHYNALPGLLKRFTVGAIYVGPRMFEDQTAALRLLRQSFEQSGAQLGELFAGDRLRVDQQVSIEVLHPPASGVAGSDNANSIVLSVEYAGKRILLTGDLESPGLESLMNEPPLDCDVVLAPHHGSARSDPPSFAAWSTPDFVVVSGGRGDDSQAVKNAYESHDAAVLNTAQCGAVTALVRKDGLDVRCFRTPAKRSSQ